MKKLRRLLSLLLVAAAFGSVSACTDITAWEDCVSNDIPGSNNRCNV
jgi:hypothetical protein